MKMVGQTKSERAVSSSARDRAELTYMYSGTVRNLIVVYNLAGLAQLISGSQ